LAKAGLAVRGEEKRMAMVKVAFRLVTLCLGSCMKHMKRLNIFIVLGIIISLIGCSSNHNKSDLNTTAASMLKSPGTAESVAAGDFLLALYKQGTLPGDFRGGQGNDHGEIKSDEVPLSDLQHIAYPLSRTFHVIKPGVTFTNNYIVVKLSKDSSWKLQRAWETGSNGQVIKEWPVQ
jgi:hypothetical protein